MSKSFNFVKEFGPITKIGGFHVPAFIFDAREPVLFDPGVSAFGPMYLKELTARFGARVRESLLMLLTHSHFDHCGAAPYLLRAIPAARIGCSPRAADVLHKEKAIALIKEFNAEYEDRMKEGLQGQDTSFNALPISLRLKEGDTIKLADATLEIFETPGIPGTAWPICGRKKESCSRARLQMYIQTGNLTAYFYLTIQATSAPSAKLCQYSRRHCVSPTRACLQDQHRLQTICRRHSKRLNATARNLNAVLRSTMMT